MKSIKEKTKLNVSDLNKEELENTYGGAWWEIRYEEDVLILIFHPTDDNKPQ